MALGIGGLSTVADAHPHGPGGGPPSGAGPPPGGGPPPWSHASSGQAAGAHGKPPADAHGKPPANAHGTPPANAPASSPASQPSHHAGAHGPHKTKHASIQTRGNGHPGHPRTTIGRAAAKKPAATAASTQPVAATRSARLSRALQALSGSIVHAGAIGLPTLGTTLGTTVRTGPVTGATARRLSVSRLRALVPAPDTPNAHSQVSSTHAPPAGVRTSDSSSPSVIQRIEHDVPFAVWIALAAALALAATAGTAMLVAGRRARHQAARLAAVSAQALTDPLTGVLNRRGFLDALERELARARRYERPVALAYVDVRGLKAVNDSEGHRAGDELLREAASLLKDSARADDVVGRIGGDELAVLLGEQSTDGATAVATRIHAQVPARREALELREPWDLTIGTASYPADGKTVDELLAAADRRLYEQRGIDIR